MIDRIREWVFEYRVRKEVRDYHRREKKRKREERFYLEIDRRIRDNGTPVRS